MSTKTQTLRLTTTGKKKSALLNKGMILGTTLALGKSLGKRKKIEIQQQKILTQESLEKLVY
jgi:hypothetical protein